MPVKGAGADLNLESIISQISYEVFIVVAMVEIIMILNKNLIHLLQYF